MARFPLSPLSLRYSAPEHTITWTEPPPFRVMILTYGNTYPHPLGGAFRSYLMDDLASVVFFFPPEFLPSFIVSPLRPGRWLLGGLKPIIIIFGKKKLNEYRMVCYILKRLVKKKRKWRRREEGLECWPMPSRRIMKGLRTNPGAKLLLVPQCVSKDTV